MDKSFHKKNGARLSAALPYLTLLVLYYSSSGHCPIDSLLASLIRHRPSILTPCLGNG